MIRTFILAFLCLLGGHYNGLAQSEKQVKWDLQQCINYAVENNIQVKQLELEQEIAIVNKQSASYDFLPNLSAGSQHSWTIVDKSNPRENFINSQTMQGTSFSAGLSLDIYKGMEKQHRMVKSRLDALASSYSTQKIKEDISLNVINSYLQILFNKELVLTNEKQLNYDTSQMQRTEILVDAGTVPAGDLLEAKATVATSNQRLIISQNELVMAKLNLAQLLQIKDYETFDISDEQYEIQVSDVLSYSPWEITNRAFESLTDIKSAVVKQDIAQRNVQIAKSAMQPTLRGFYNLATQISYQDRVVGQKDLGVQSTIGFVEGTNQAVLTQSYGPVMAGPDAFFDQFKNNLNSNFGFALSIPIFNGFKARNNIRINKLVLKQVENEKEQAVLKLEQLVFKAYTDTQSSLNSFEASQATLESRNKSFEYANERYEVGLINIFELNQNQMLLVNAQSEVLKAKYDYIFKTKILEYYFGIPLF
ncbi:TolC family protein [Myroides sp. LJL119]